MSTLRVSTKMRDLLMAGFGFKALLQNGAIYRYSGSMPSSADLAPPSGNTLLDIITQDGLTRTAEVCGAGSVSLTGGAAGSVDSITVDSVQLLKANLFDSAATVVPFNTSLPQTAIDVAAQINLGSWWHGYIASVSGQVITLTAVPGKGTSVNSKVVAFTGTTITATTANISGGVAPVNGIQLGAVSSGTILGSGTQKGTGLANGTVQWARWIGSVSDAMGNSTDQIRLDMDAATANAIMVGTSMVVAEGAESVCTSLSMVWPASN